MKKIIISFSIVVLCALTVFFVSGRDSNISELTKLNITALADGPGNINLVTVCFGPKDVVSGIAICKCRNSVPCRDNEGCQ